ncbi:MAG: cation diffusion facilitator family transporter [Cellvibrionales bacterium TMED47]|nr:divalent metal cation transporter FieF [Porticoccaceae bacterium]RPG82195.1 MAG: cation diffusion facilitator family transporter [Cellvibrionales bacterium TMED47]
MRWATYASVSVAVFLITVKLIAWGRSDSVSLLATLVDSVLDAFASIINLIAVRHALTPADKEHRFGHGKAEALAGLSQSLFIAGSSLFLLLEAAQAFVNPAEIKHAFSGIAVMAISIVATLGLVSFQHYVIKKTRSVAIRADALHYKSDILVNCAVILALWLSTMGLNIFDPIIGGLIACYILYSVWSIVSISLDQLMDRELSDEVRTKIKQLVLAHPQSSGIHDLRTRHSGTMTFIQFHLEIEDDLTLVQAHNVSDEIELELLKIYPDSEIIIHIDPKSVVGKETVATFE